MPDGWLLCYCHRWRFLLLSLAMLLLTNTALGGVQTDCSRTEMIDALKGHFGDQLVMDDDTVSGIDGWKTQLVGEDRVMLASGYEQLPAQVKQRCPATKAAEGALTKAIPPEYEQGPVPIRVDDWVVGPKGIVSLETHPVSQPEEYAEDFHKAMVRLLPSVEKCVAKASKKSIKAQKGPLQPSNVILSVGVDHHGEVVKMERKDLGFDGKELKLCMERRLPSARVPFATSEGRYKGMVMMAVLASDQQ